MESVAGLGWRPFRGKTDEIALEWNDEDLELRRAFRGFDNRYRGPRYVGR